MMGGLSDQPALMRAAQQYIREVARAREALDVSPAGKGASMLCVTATAGNYPTSAQSVYVVNPAELDCDDTEGAAATNTPDSSQAFFAVNVGTGVPPQGTEVVCHGVGGRWVFRYDDQSSNNS